MHHASLTEDIWDDYGAVRDHAQVQQGAHLPPQLRVAQVQQLLGQGAPPRVIVNRVPERICSLMKHVHVQKISCKSDCLEEEENKIE